MESVIRIEHLDGDVWLIAAIGEHDINTAPDLDARLAKVREQGTHVILDFSEATFADSSIVQSILRYAHEPREFAVVVAPPETPPRRTFDLVALAGQVPVCDSRDDAIQVLARQVDWPASA